MLELENALKKMGKKFCEGGQTLEQVGCGALELFKTQLDMVLSILHWVTLICTGICTR